MLLSSAYSKSRAAQFPWIDTKEVHKKLGETTARTADGNWPKGHSIPRNIMASIKTLGNWLGGTNCCLGMGKSFDGGW